MIVEIRPLKIKKWHGLEGDKSFTRPKTIEAAVSGETGKYNVLFESEEEKEHLEKELGYDLSLRFDPEKPHPFWTSRTAWVELPNHTMFLNTDNPLDRIKLAVIKGHPTVANSQAEYERGEWEKATHVIYSQADEMQQKAKKIEIKKKAIKHSLEMSKEDKIRIIQILTQSRENPAGESYRAKSDNFIDVKIDELCDEKPKEFVKWAEMDAETRAVRALVLESHFQNQLRKEGPAYFYGADRIGIDLDAAVSFLKDPENQDYRIRLQEKIGW